VQSQPAERGRQALVGKVWPNMGSPLLDSFGGGLVLHHVPSVAMSPFSSRTMSAVIRLGSGLVVDNRPCSIT
jgi:hypothetical protein